MNLNNCYHSYTVYCTWHYILKDCATPKTSSGKKKRLLKESGQFKQGAKDAGKGDSFLANFLPGANPVTDLVIKLVQQQIRKRKNSKKADINPPQIQPPHKSKIKALAIEFIGGYLKWKAIELTYKGVRHVIKTAKEKK